MLMARRNLGRDRTRLLLNIAGVALAILLILLLTGIREGMFRQITSYLDRTPGSLLVSQGGVENLLSVTSLLPAGATARVQGTRGVESVIPILSQYTILDLHGRKQAAYLIGYVPARGGGPWRLAAGRAPRADDEAVFDRVLAERHDLALGDRVDVMGRTLEVVGLSEGTTSWMTSFFFLRKSAVESLVRLPGATSFLLVTTDEGASVDDVRSRLASLDGVDVHTKGEIAANDRKLFARYFSAPVTLMAAIAALVGALVVGLVIYTATVERERDFGVLKAIGAPNRSLYLVVVAQSLIASLGGVVAGSVLAIGARAGIMALRPQFLIVLEPADFVLALVVGLGIAMVAGLYPARRIGGLAPAEVFRR